MSFTFHSGYIPLNSTDYTYIWSFALYIPFWIYSTKKKLVDEDKSEVFTLHSILDIFHLARGSDGKNYTVDFTFHSGYIPLVTEVVKAAGVCALHSILDIFH